MSELETLRAEYEAFQTKTRDWQSKVRDRDTLMKQRITESTQQLKEKDALHEENVKTIRELTERNDLIKQHAVVVEERLVESEIAIGAMRSDAKRASDSEETLRTKHDEVLRLRERVATLDGTLTRLRAETDGSDVFQHGAFTVKARCDVGTAVWCCVASEDGTIERWMTQDKLAGHRVQMPPTGREAATAQVGKETAKRFQMLQDVVEEKHFFFQTWQHQALAALSTLLSKYAATFQSAVAATRQQCEAKVEQIQSEAHLLRASAVESSLVSHKEETESLGRELSALRDEYAAYKTKAQTALKRSAAAPVPAAVVVPAATAKPDVQSSSAQTDAPPGSRNMSKLAQTDAAVPSTLEKDLEKAKHLIVELREHIGELELCRGKQNQHDVICVGMQTDVVVPVMESTTPAKPARVVPALLSNDSVTSFESAESSHDGGGGQRSPASTLDFTALMYANNASQSPNVAHAEQKEFSSEQAKQNLEREHRRSLLLERQVRELRVANKSLEEHQSSLMNEIRSLQMVSDLASFQESVGNVEYIKNVMIRFMISKDTHGVQKDLVPVLATLLRLSSEELQQVQFFYR